MTGERATLGIVGGSGFYEIEGLTSLRSLDIDTPFGRPSGPVVLGEIGGVPLAFVSRHGPGHVLLPNEVPYRANIWALASLGVRQLVSVSAVGSLKEEVEPLHFVVPDQLIDRTSALRPSTFFGEGVVAHVALDRPYCPGLSIALAAAVGSHATVHRGGALVVIEGPAFSTRAESYLYKAWDATVIGMTALPEAKLAREAGMCYACLACVTDYDTWHEDHGAVTVELVVRNLLQNVAIARASLAGLVAALPDWRSCSCCDSLAGAVITPAALVPDTVRQKLAPILSRYHLR
jgi:5'-methylthioadenosine phosphorylase